MDLYRKSCERIAWWIIDQADLHEYRAYRRGAHGVEDVGGVLRPATAGSLRARAARAVVAHAQRRAVR